MAVDVTTEPAFAVLSAPAVLFDDPNYSRIQNFGLTRTWDIHPDGSRFIMVASEGGEAGVGSLTEVYLVTRSSPELCVKVRGSSSMLLLGCLGDLLRFEKREIQVATFAPDRSSP